MCRQDIINRKHVGKHALLTHFISTHTLAYGAFNVCINSPNPFNFPHSRFRNTVFSLTEKTQTFNKGKGGHRLSDIKSAKDGEEEGESFSTI